LVLARRSKKKPADVVVDAPDRLGRTALHYAACASVGCVAALLEAGANPFVRENRGFEPAAVAEREGHPEPAAALRAAMRDAEAAAAAAAAALEEEDPETTRPPPGKSAEKRKAKKKKEKPPTAPTTEKEANAEETTRDVTLAIAPGWAAAFAARDGESNEFSVSTENGEKDAEKKKKAVSREPEPVTPVTSPSRGAASARVSPKYASDPKPKPRLEVEAPAPAPSARSWAAVATGSGAAAASVAPRAPRSLSADASTLPESSSSFSSESGWESEARARLERRHPTACALKVSLRNLLGLGVDEMSASQLEAAEDVHRELLACLTDARVELARRQERARLEEAAAIERTIETLAAAGAR
jgi:hypothetical protein